MKPGQIVRGFAFVRGSAYRGAVLDKAPCQVLATGNPASWSRLRALAAQQPPLLSAPQPGDARLCGVCHGPSGRGSTRCYQCDLHLQCASGSLADIVAPVAFAIKGSSHAVRLWQYKSPRPGAGISAAAALTLRALLLVFLRDHGPCLWQAAGIAGPTHLAVVPTARGRPGQHPLRALVDEHLAGPWAGLSARGGGEQARDLDPARFTAAALPRARVLLLDDTWTTGSSAQSAAMALRRAGASSIVTVVLGRHVGQGAAESAGIGPERMPFRRDRCAVHQRHVVGR
jgi:hypothetical protein